MFSESAALYDLYYGSVKDYEAEADQLAALIGRVVPSARRLLDVACGTGEHARLLAERGFAVDGIDLEPDMVRIAAAKVMEGRFTVADMTDFSLPARYDVVLCLFSAIGYVRTRENVERALTCFARHLAPGGAIIVEPWFAPGALTEGRVTARTVEGDGVTMTRMSHVAVEGRLSRVTFEYLIGRADGIRHATELHLLGLFTDDEMQACFRAAGLTVEHDPVGLSDRGLYVARAG